MKNPIKTFYQFFLNRKLIKNLEENHLEQLEILLLTINDKYANINYGGCGVFAYELAKELIAKGFECKIAWLSSSNENQEIFLQKLKDGELNGLYDVNQLEIYCSHCYVQIGDNYIDSDGITKKDGLKTYGGVEIINIDTPMLIKPLIENDEGWNARFDRELIPFIKKDLKKLVENLVI